MERTASINGVIIAHFLAAGNLPKKTCKFLNTLFRSQS